MAGFRTAEGRIVLGPTDWRTGGDTIARDGAGVITGLSAEPELLSEASVGSTAMFIRYVNFEALANFRLLDYDDDAVTFIERNLLADYDLGTIVPDERLLSLLVRPTNADDPHLWLPRAAILAVGSPVYERNTPITTDMDVTVVGLYSKDHGKPYVYGVPADLGPMFPEPE